MKLGCVHFVPATRWCRAVDDPTAVLAQPDTVWVARPAEAWHVAPPVATLPDDPLTSPAFSGGDAIDLRDHTESAGPTFLAQFADARIEATARLWTRRDPFHVRIAPGLALADAYHHRALTESVMERTDELVPAEAMGRPIRLPLVDEGPPDSVVDGPAVLLASRFGHHNYFHWLFEGIGRLWCLDAVPDAGRLPLLLPSNELRTFHRDTLAALGVRNPLLPLRGGRIAVGRLLFPSFLGPGTYGPALIDFLRRRLLPAFGVTPWPSGGRRLWLSREDAQARAVVPDPALRRLLAAYGVQTVVPGRMSVADQVRVFAEADLVIAPHGAGNANMVFAPPGAALVELVPSVSRDPLYWIVAGAAGQRYARLLCRQTRMSGALAVDAERLETLLRRVLN